MQRLLLTLTLGALVAITSGCAGQKFNLVAASGSVQVSGQSAVRAGDTAEFTAVLPAGTADGVQWSVNGIVGGDQTFGTISSTGEFTAPLALPSENKVTIRAASTGNAELFGEAEVQLLNPVPVIYSAAAENGGDFFEIQITGSNLASGVTAKINGTSVTTTRVTPTKLKAFAPATITAASSVQISVANPEPGAAESENITLAITRPSRPMRGALTNPSLPAQMFDYVSYATTNLPSHYSGGPVANADTTPDAGSPGGANPITNAGATLGRVLFYDRRLSVNNNTSCASCHRQMNGFADPDKFSTGFAGGKTGRHGSALGNAKYYLPGRYFWDERAATLEQQALMPIQDPVEMGMTLAELNTKLQNTSFYPPLFQAAFGTPEVTSDRISKALSQFVRAMVTYQSKFDQAITPGSGVTFTASESAGQAIFNGPAGRCSTCHATNAHISGTTFNTGLDATITDPGVLTGTGIATGRFKSPSLRNSGVRVLFMHDGRFKSLEEVVEFYNSGVQNNPQLSPILRDGQGNPLKLNLTAQQKADLIAFLHTLTDNNFLNDPKFRDPF